MFYYDPNRKGFLVDTLHKPEDIKRADIIPLTDEEYSTLAAGLSQGKYVEVENGKPVLIDQPKPTPEQQWAAVRRTRNFLLSESDWTQLSDVPEKTRDHWAAYRQELRDVPLNFQTPIDVVWPEKP